MGEMRTAFLDLPGSRQTAAVEGTASWFYFVFTYFCGAVYNNSPFRKMKMAAASTLLIEELAMAAWRQHGRQMGFLDFVDAAHRFSKGGGNIQISLGVSGGADGKGKGI